jgi:predicted dehydrogenase
MRFGFVGLGWAARGFHLPALKELSRVEVVGGYDADVEQRASWESETGFPSFASLDDMYEHGRPDVTVVATPPDSHTALCLRALEEGTHVFCEKPFVPTVADAGRVLDAARAAGKQIAVNHEFREKPIFRALIDGVESGEYGRLVFCQVWQLMDLPPWDEHVAWRAAMPNRTLFEGGVHLVDLILALFGELPAGVYARHSSGFDGRDADAIHLVTLDWPDGRLAQLTIDRLCPAGTRYAEVRADCERASLRASHGGRAVAQIGLKRAERPGVRIDFGRKGIAWVERGLSRKMLARNPANDGAFGTARLLAKVVPAFERNEEPPSSGRVARDVLAITEAAYRSADTGNRVELERVPAAPVG